MDSTMIMVSAAASSTASSPEPLTTYGFNLTNATDQANFLGELLDDTYLQVTSNAYATYFWYGVVCTIAVVTIFNFLLWTITYSRVRSAAKSPSSSSNVPNPLSRLTLSFTSLIRKISYPQVTLSHLHGSRLLTLPPFGIILLLFGYLAFVLVLEYINIDTPGDQFYEAIGIRAGWLTITQLPLLILLSGKVNLIGLFTGVSYERLNVLHRWVARTMWLTASFHLAYQQVVWDEFGLRQLEYSTDSCIPTGYQAYAFLVWMNISTFAPIRNWWYEFFVIQHILTFFGLIISFMLHLPDTALYSRIYIWIPIGIYLFDRLIRTLHYAYNNIRPGRATLIKEEGGVTKIIVRTKQIKKWTPGSFVLLGIPRYGIGQSHPATIASIPSSHGGDLVFILHAHHGFTTRIHKDASSISLDSAQEEIEAQAFSRDHLALLDGPYGGKHLDFASFTTVVLIAGSTGITFTISILLDLAFRTEKQTLPVKRVVFVWAVKKASCSAWISPELQKATEALQNTGIELKIKIFVTSDDEFVDESEGESQRGEIVHSEVISGEKIKNFSRKVTVASSEKSETSQPTQRARNNATTFVSRRPDIKGILEEARAGAEGEIGVAVCGPTGLTAAARREVARMESFAENGIYLHAESFGW